MVSIWGQAADYLMYGELFSWACTYRPGMRYDLCMKSYSVGRGFIFPVEPGLGNACVIFVRLSKFLVLVTYVKR